MTDPIATLLEFTGRPATLMLAAAAPAYDPKSTTIWMPGAPLSLPMLAQYQKVTKDGQPVGVVATLTFTPSPFTGSYAAYSFDYDETHDATRVMNGAALVGQLVPHQSRVLVRGLTMSVATCRPRYYLNALNGFTLGLMY